MIRTSSILLAMLALASCGGGSRYTGRTGAEAVSAVYDRIAMHGDSPAEVRRSLGEPVRIDREAVPNRHGYGTDTTISMVHAAWRHEFLALGASDRVLLTGVETTDSGVSFPAGLRVGSTSAAELRTRLGPPDEEAASADTTVLRWRNPAMEADSHVELVLVRDTVRLLRWIPYVD